MQGNRKQVLVCSVAAFLTGPLFALAADPPGRAPLKNYEAGTIAPSEYVMIDRLWVARWRSAFDVPRHANQEAARHGLLNEAARIGGDGVVNLHCIESTGPDARVNLGGHYCYGNVINLK